MIMDKILTPQNPPKEKGIVVYDHLKQSLIDVQASTKLYELAYQRYQQGMEKYHQPLMSDDGRDTESDIIQEILDALFYVQKGIIQGRDWYTLLNHLVYCAELFLSGLDKG